MRGKRKQQTLLEVAEARAKKQLLEPALLKDDRPYKLMAPHTISALESLYARYSEQRTRGEEGASQILLGVEFLDSLSHLIGRGLYPNRAFQRCIYQMMEDYEKHRSQKLSIMAARVYRKFLSKFPPCTKVGEDALQVHDDSKENSFWHPAWDLSEHGADRSRGSNQPHGFQLIYSWIKNVVDLLRKGQTALGHALALDSLVTLLETDLHPRLDLLKDRRENGLSMDVSKLLHLSMIWKLMEAPGSTWDPSKGDAVELLALGMAAAQGFPPVEQWQHQDKKEAQHALFPQEAGEYLKRFMLIVLNMYGIAERENWLHVKKRGSLFNQVHNPRLEMDDALISAALEQPTVKEFKGSFRRKMALLSAFQVEDQIRLLTVFLARKAHINKCPSKYLEDIYERQINSHEAPGDYVIDPKALLAFLNKKNNFRMACHALTDIGSDGMVFYIAAIVKLVLQYSEYKSMQVEVEPVITKLTEKLITQNKISGSAFLEACLSRRKMQIAVASE